VSPTDAVQSPRAAVQRVARSVVVGTAGHIDHGKSTLVRALTGIDPDRLKEEQERGITIDLGFAHVSGDALEFAFVDVPGHERFVKNMLAGVGGIDMVVLVVAADESVMPQTREHFQICRLLEIPAGIIVLTKSDLADPEMLELARIETRELVAGSFLADAPVVPVSSRTGAGLSELRTALQEVASRLPRRNPEGPLRLPIDRVFTVKGFGTVVTGTLVSGEIREDQELVVLPGALRVKVRGLQVHGRRESVVSAGHRLAVNIGGADVGEIHRGDTLTESGSFEPTRRFDAIVSVLPDARAVKHGSRVRFHHGTVERLGRLAVAGAAEGPGGASEVAAGGSAYVRIRLEAPAVLTRGDRFILRAYSPTVTIGGGVVLDPHPPRSAIRTEPGLRRFRRLAGVGSAIAGIEGAVLAFLDERGAAGFSRNALISRAGLSASAAAATAERLVGSGQAVTAGDLLVASAVVTELSDRLLAAVAAHHAAAPLSDGLPREEARERLFGRAAPAVFDRVIADLVARERIVARDRLALAGHHVSLSPEETRARDTIAEVYRDAGLTPPELAGAAAASGVAPALADRMAKLLLRQKVLVKVDTMYFHAESLARLRSEIRALKTDASTRATVDVASFKERYGITRKYAIPLLEYLDRERITRRVGEGRVVL
jgi:selenocysteine-specific elongation factor